MGIDTWTYHSTYRGIVIQVYTASATGITTYAAFTDTWYLSTSLSAIKGVIDDFLGPVEPEPYWTYHSTYRGIEIQVWMPDGTPFTAYFDGKWHTAAYLSTLKAAIDDFLEPEPEPEIPTSLSISAPSSVEPNEAFYVSGTLYETQTGSPIPNKTISLSYNGVSLGNTQTNANGDYQIQAFIPTEGTYTLRAAFAGNTTLGAAESTSKVRTGALALQALVPIVVVGVVAYLIFKK